jgi:hypothetical protein
MTPKLPRSYFENVGFIPQPINRISETVLPFRRFSTPEAIEARRLKLEQKLSETNQDA